MFWKDKIIVIVKNNSIITRILTDNEAVRFFFTGYKFNPYSWNSEQILVADVGETWPCDSMKSLYIVHGETSFQFTWTGTRIEYTFVVWNHQYS